MNIFEYISIGSVSIMLGVSITTLRRWHKSERLVPNYITFGGHRRYKRHDIIAVIDPSSADKQRFFEITYMRLLSPNDRLRPVYS